MKTHMNFETADLDASVAFYSVLLDVLPAKRFDDYALFIVEEPALELALDAGGAIANDTGAHYGIAVSSMLDVERVAERLHAHGFVRDVRLEESCCYAQQSKVWTSDPEGRRWEVYVVHEETERRDGVLDACCSHA